MMLLWWSFAIFDPFSQGLNRCVTSTFIYRQCHCHIICKTAFFCRTRKTQNQKRERSREFVGVRGSLRELKGTQGNWVKINLACSHTNMNHLGVVNHSHDYFPSNRLSNFQMIFVQSVPGSACHFSRNCLPQLVKGTYYICLSDMRTKSPSFLKDQSLYWSIISRIIIFYFPCFKN